MSQIRNFEVFKDLYVKIKAYNDSRYGKVSLYKARKVDPNQGPEDGYDFILVKEKWRNRVNKSSLSEEKITDCIDLLSKLYDRNE